MQWAQHIIAFNKDKPRNKWENTTNASDDIGNKARKNKFYKLTSLFPHLIFILFSFTLFLRLTTSSGRQNKSTYKTSSSRIPQTNYKVPNGKIQEINYLLVWEAIYLWQTKTKMVANKVETNGAKKTRRNWIIIRVIGWIKRSYCDVKKATVHAQLQTWHEC